MSRPVIFAEKPNQAKAYAEAFKNTKRRNGYIEIEPNEIFIKGAYITWGVGHLLQIPMPGYFDPKWEKWNLETLPIKPEKFEFVISERTKEQYEVVEKLLKHEASEIIVASDCDREGENIAWSVIEKLGVSHKPIKRLWINSLDEEIVREGFMNLKNGHDYYNLYIESKTRQISDYLIGMNASPLYSLILQEHGINKSFSVGRVQTPTLCLINQREKAIENFQQQNFYEPSIMVEHMNGHFEAKAEGKFFDKKEGIELLNKNDLTERVKKLSEITKVTKSLQKESSPKLYILSTLQTRANKLWKFSPSKTLEVVQKLYEKKLLTYPRTDIPYITEKEFEYLMLNFKAYQKVIGKDFPCFNDQPQKRYVDSKKVVEHYAIVMTKNVPTESELNALSSEEQKIYKEVVLNTLSMFHEPYQYEKTVIEIISKELNFKATGKVEKVIGWKELFGKEETNNNKDEKQLPSVEEGEPIQITPFLSEGKTTKPKRLTEGDLIGLMINAGKNLPIEEQEVLNEVEGANELELGTQATRANIIDTLKEKEYIKIEKNLVYVTSKGVVLSEAVEGTLLASPVMTAKWEAFLKQIGKGEREAETFINSIYTFINKLIKEVPDMIKPENIKKYIEDSKSEGAITKCPLCKTGHIIERSNFYGCTNREGGCKQTFSKQLLGKNISVTQLKKLIEKGKTDVIKGFKGKKEFDAFLTLEDTEGSNKKYKLNFK